MISDTCLITGFCLDMPSNFSGGGFCLSSMISSFSVDDKFNQIPFVLCIYCDSCQSEITSMDFNGPIVAFYLFRITIEMPAKFAWIKSF